MAFRSTTALKKIIRLKKRLRVIQGGARAGKTIAILMALIDIAQSHKNQVISVIGESVPFLKRGPIRDFISILQAQGYYNDSRWNKSDFIYKFETGSIIEFFSADSSDKVRGPARDHLFINECNNIRYETFRQLEIRTRGVIYLDFNPLSEFWVHTKIIPKQDHDFLVLTYKDNEALSPAIVEALESHKDSKNWWRVFGEGQIGEAEGRIYTGWRIIDEIPFEARLEGYGLDYGYSADPTAIIAVYYCDGGYILDEIIYRKGMSNKQIADVFNGLPYGLVIADSAEPKSNDEIKSYGVNILPTVKGRDSIRQGIQFVQDQKISVTKRSTNVIKEYRNYLWKTDKDGKTINEPEGGFDHALDAIRYKLTSLHPNSRNSVKSYKKSTSRAVW